MGKLTNQISTEAESLSISAISDWGIETNSKKCVTKQRLADLFCTAKSSTYQYNKLVKHSDVVPYKAYVVYKSSQPITIPDASNWGALKLSNLYNSSTTIGHLASDEDDITIPSMTTIPTSAFASKHITHLKISNNLGIKTVAKNAIYKTSITKLELPNSVTTIDISNLRGTSYTDIFLGGNITSIGTGSSMELSERKLEHIIFTSTGGRYDDGSNYAGSNVLYDNNTKTVMLGCKNSIIPEGTTILFKGAFSGIKTLPSDFYTILKSDTIEQIQTYVFYSSNFNTSQWFTALKNIDILAFESCNSLTNGNFTMCANLTKIGSNAFQDCTRLTELVFNPIHSYYFGAEVFKNCTNIKNVYGLYNKKMSRVTGYQYPDFLDDTQWYKDQGVVCKVPYNKTTSYPYTLYKYKNNTLGDDITIASDIQYVLNGAIIPSQATKVTFTQSVISFDGTTLGSNIQHIYVPWDYYTGYTSQLTQDVSKIHLNGIIGIIAKCDISSYYSGTFDFDGGTSISVSPSNTTVNKTMNAKDSVTINIKNFKFQSVLKNPIKIYLSNDGNTKNTLVGQITQTLTPTGGSGTTTNYTGSLTFVPAHYIDKSLKWSFTTNSTTRRAVYLIFSIPTT